MHNKASKVLALLLCLCLLLTGVPGMAALAVGDDDAAESPAEDASLVKDLDPSTLGVHKLGELEEEEAPDLSGLTPDTSLKELVRVSIFLSEPSAIDAGYSAQGIGRNQSAVSYRTSLLNKQKSVQASIESKLGYSLDVAWNLTLLTNAFSTWVYGKDIPVIERMDGVIAVQRENMYTVPVTESGAQPDTANTSSAMVGASGAWDAGYTGAGTRIAIIDTGIDTDHISFAAEPFEHAIEEYEKESGKTVDLLTADEIPAMLNGEGEYLTSKIPYAYNYVDGNMTVNHLSDRQGEHGSHVAGIAAANRFVKDGDSFADAVEAVHVVGMAPDAQLLVMKVFGVGGGAYDSDYFAAIEDAIAMDADAVNLSLGGGAPGFSYDNYYQDILNALSDGETNVGTVTSMSAGNSGSYIDYNVYYQNYGIGLFIDDVSMHTGGSPGTFINSLGVASADNTGKTGAPLVFNGEQNVFINESATSSGATFADIAGSSDFVYIDGTGTEDEYAAADDAVGLEGKIVIVNRGTLTFVEKGNNAIPYNPKGVIIANNQAGTIGMILDDYVGTFPMASMTQADAAALKAASEKGTAGSVTYYTGSVAVSDEIVSMVMTDRAEAQISSFSSWGVPGSLLMKPEITAPGGDIYSVFGTSFSSNGEPQGGTDMYELMGGTSMAAPHIAGLAALTAQYLKEADYEALNPGLANYSRRAVIQSLLMSTATPMVDADGYYYSILQQGAGLADVSRAVSSSSVIMMKDAGLTTATGAAADGKVKAELGDDPDRTGVFSYSFTVYNLTDKDLTYKLSTELFTQYLYQQYGYMFMDKSTDTLSANVVYDFERGGYEPHDVNGDGATNDTDAQAVLDYITGAIGGEGLDLAAADMDGDGEITSHDAYLLLQYSEEVVNALIVKAGSSKDVKVTFAISENDLAFLDRYFTNGAYVEGYTYVECTTASAEGVAVEDVHSIPILGFYGNWTDASMFDNTSLTDLYYATDELNYSGNDYTNYLTVKYGSQLSAFYGNPYYIEYDEEEEEGEFPADALAVNSKNQFVKLYYNLIRSAGTTGFAVSKTDELGGDVTEVLASSVDGWNVNGLYYYVNGGTWENTGTKVQAINKTAASYGLQEGDTFRIGYYAIPEYYAMLLHGDDMTAEYAGNLDDDEFAELLEANVLGRGAFVGYDFTVDDTAPEITGVELDEETSEVKITASDNQNIAYVAVVSLDGEEYYGELAPHAKEYSDSLDISDAIENADGYVAIFVADYAGNETAKALKVNDKESIDPLKVDEISIEPDELYLYKGNEEDLSVSILPLTVEDRSVTWTSSDESVVTVDESGHIVAVAGGEAVITATSTQDETKSATCDVSVLCIDREIRGIVWDENGEVYFSEFNTNDLPNYTKLHDSKAAYEVQNTLAVDDDELYAATLDGSTATTDVYSVDPDTFELTEVAPNYLWAPDMAAGATDQFDMDDFVGMVYPYAYMVIAGTVAPEDDGYGVISTGVPYGYADFGAATGGAYFAGIAAKERNAHGGTYYLLDENGVIWETTLSFNNAYINDPMGELPFVFSDLTKVLETDIQTNFLYQDLYYDGTYLYWSHYADSVSTLYVIDLKDEIIYDAGNFGSGVWPVSGFYETARTAPAQGGSDDTSGIEIRPLALDKNELMTAEIARRFAAAAAKAPAGGLNAVNATARPAESRDHDKLKVSGEATVYEEYYYGYDLVVVDLTEDEDVTNGLITVSADEALYYMQAGSDVYYSDYYDEETGTVTFAYASVAPIPAGEIFATLYYVNLDNENPQTVAVDVYERNEDYDVDEPTKKIVIGEPVPEFKSQSLVLSGEIALKFNLELPEIEGVDYSESYMEFTVGKQAPVRVDFAKATQGSNGRWGFLCYVKSIQMADTITAEFHYGDGKSVSKEYSVEQYIKRADELSDQLGEKAITLIHAIADYGHYAQIYLAEQNGWTIGEDYAEMKTFYTEEYDYADILSKVTPNAFVKAIDGTNIEKASYKLHMDAETTIDVILTTKDGSAPKNVEVSVHEMVSGKTVTTSVTPVKDSQGRYVISIPAISAHKLGDMYTVTGEAGGTFTVQVSALSYVRSVLNAAASSDAARDGMSSLYGYYAATLVYRGKA